MDTVLKRVGAGDVRTYPFPHVVIENALDEALAQRLADEYPSIDTLTTPEMRSISNKRFNCPVADVRKIDAISPLWKSFLEVHVSDMFFRQFVSIFREHLLEIYPALGAWWNAPDKVRIGIKDIDAFDTGSQVLLSAFIAGNTPVVGRTTSVKVAHLDNTNKFYAGLFYLRHPQDDSEGGDLELCTYTTDKPHFYGQRLISKRFVKPVVTIPYRHNTLVLFPTHFHALHGVTPRQPTKHVRRFMNLVGEVRSPLFSLDAYRETVLDKVRRKIFSF